MNIYIANIPFKANEDDVRGIFESYGQVASVRIVLDKDTQKSRGFGFVIMNNDNEASVAIHQLNGFDMMGKMLSVSEAKPKESRPEQGRRPFSGDRPQGDRPAVRAQQADRSAGAALRAGLLGHAGRADGSACGRRAQLGLRSTGTVQPDRSSVRKRLYRGSRVFLLTGADQPHSLVPF